ncbi:unnamed protein product [Caenorhabditis auriculariae]|uniref:Uncharacterized protein n=1 Tax=Caenorhabditis auriculariae TaxID=2777116 RepID=A0A8S1GWA4_9PELO|nr:unnamed protein product [Caenorhabditis auriculariae]
MHAASRTYFLTSQTFGLRGARIAGLARIFAYKRSALGAFCRFSRTWDLRPSPSLVAARLLRLAHVFFGCRTSSLGAARLPQLPHVFRNRRTSSAAAARLFLRAARHQWLPLVFFMCRTSSSAFLEPLAQLFLRSRLGVTDYLATVAGLLSTFFLKRSTSSKGRKSTKRCQEKPSSFDRGRHCRRSLLSGNSWVFANSGGVVMRTKWEGREQSASIATTPGKTCL